MVKFKDQLKKIIFGTETFGGRLFDILLIFAITSSVLIVMLDSVSEYHDAYGKVFVQIEWIFTILFTLEYILRIYCIRLPSSYIFSFFGIIDFLAILPTYISFFIPGAGVFSVIRILRVLRVFRVLKLVQFMGRSRAPPTSDDSKQKKNFCIFILFAELGNRIGFHYVFN